MDRYIVQRAATSKATTNKQQTKKKKKPNTNKPQKQKNQQHKERFVPLPSAVFAYVQTPNISLSNKHFFGDIFDVLCFQMYKLQTYLKTSLYCAFYRRKPCHDHTFDLLCFHMYKPQSNLNSRQRTKPTVAARKKRN